MKEDFLHYVWSFQKFGAGSFSTANDQTLHIRSTGSQNGDSGPDFFNAQIELDDQLWAGNVEIHIKSSDWYAHGHENDPAYDNVILHVVWEHDVEVYGKDGNPIPTFEIKKHVAAGILEQYYKLFSKERKWINCENDFATVDDFVVGNWLERLYIERLQQKQNILLKELAASNNHWEALLYRMLCKNFGLKVNGKSFYSIAQSVDFSIVKKCAHDRQNLEALLMGQAGLLEGEKEDWYFKTLKVAYGYLVRKHRLQNESTIKPKFFRLRPPNFPTVRLAQFAMLYHTRPNLFSSIVETWKKEEFYELFNVYAAEYWDTHYNFGISSLERKKRVTKKMVDLLIINTLIPIKFCYATQQGLDQTEELLALASQISSEENSIIKKFNSLRPVSTNAAQSQALLQLKSTYCDRNRCLECAIGNSILTAGNRVNTSKRLDR